MPVLRIVKKYNHRSPKNGIIDVESVSFNTKEEGLQFLASVPLIKHLEWEMIDYDWVVVGDAKPEILVNPTGGKVGLI